jgi:inorganic triphosphatase YgiF
MEDAVSRTMNVASQAVPGRGDGGRTTREIELRLATVDAARRLLPKCAALASLDVSPARTRELESVYWDTPALDLNAARIALRLRRGGNGGGWVQTLKADRQNPHARDEFEGDAVGDRPDLPLAQRLGWSAPASFDVQQADLRPVFHTRVVRTTHEVTFDDGSVAELAFDRGELFVPGRDGAVEPIREIEIELSRGSARRLYELAWRLVDELPSTRMLFASKAERGYALLTGALQPRHALDIDVPRKAPAAHVAWRAAAETLAQLQANVEGARAGDAESIHQLRIGMRRLRVAAALARKTGLPAWSEALRAELAWFWETSGPTRDLDVLALQTWPAVMAGSRGECATAAFEAALAERRRESHRKLRDALDGRRFQHLAIALGFSSVLQEEAAPSAGGRTSAKLARRLLSRRAERIVERGAAIERLPAAERHRLRIDAKKLRYLGEFFAGSRARRTRRYLRRLADLQTVLGELNDLAATERTIESIAATLPSGGRAEVMALWKDYADARERMLASELGPKWRRFAKQKPFWE